MPREVLPAPGSLAGSQPPRPKVVTQVIRSSGTHVLDRLPLFLLNSIPSFNNIYMSILSTQHGAIYSLNQGQRPHILCPSQANSFIFHASVSPRYKVHGYTNRNELTSVKHLSQEWLIVRAQ